MCSPTRQAVLMACDNFCKLIEKIEREYPDELNRVLPRYLSSNPCETFFSICRAKRVSTWHCVLTWRPSSFQNIHSFCSDVQSSPWRSSVRFIALPPWCIHSGSLALRATFHTLAARPTTSTGLFAFLCISLTMENPSQILMFQLCFQRGTLLVA